MPGSALASDQHYRETDLAIDCCEDVPPLPRAAVDRIVALMEAQGMTAKVSSIHVNGWFGDYDKLATTRTLMREVFAQDVDAARDAFVFAGDSPNDAPMFAFFPNAVGVANLRRFLDRIADAARVHDHARSRRRIRRARRFPARRHLISPVPGSAWIDSACLGSYCSSKEIGGESAGNCGQSRDRPRATGHGRRERDLRSEDASTRRTASAG